MSKKLSRRDKAIFLVGIVVIVAIVGYLTLLKPKYEEVQMSNDRLAAKEKEQSEVEAKIATLEDLKKQLEKSVDSVVEDQKEFISEEDIFMPQQISTYLMDMIEPSGIEIVSVEAPVLTPNTLYAYTYNKNALAYDMKINADLAHELPEEVYYAYSRNYPAEPPGVNVGLSTVVISYRCDDASQLFDAIQLVSENDKDIYLVNASSDLAIEVTEAGVEAFLEGTMTIEVYTIYPMDPEDIDKNPVLSEEAE